jgi:hypothetical protein
MNEKTPMSVRRVRCHPAAYDATSVIQAETSLEPPIRASLKILEEIQP